jgi:methylmalonyl-CoA/ethylmalonyl-CoA epimerase
MPDHELWMAFFRDPDDNLFALMSEVRSDASPRKPIDRP